jgi:hypothetical protein
LSNYEKTEEKEKPKIDIHDIVEMEMEDDDDEGSEKITRATNHNLLSPDSMLVASMTSKQTEMLRVDALGLGNSQAMSNASSMVVRRLEGSEVGQDNSQMDSSVMESGHKEVNTATKFERAGEGDEEEADGALKPFNMGEDNEDGQPRTHSLRIPNSASMKAP